MAVVAPLEGLEGLVGEEVVVGYLWGLAGGVPGCGVGLGLGRSG